MKILCIADHVDPVVYSQSIKNRYSDIDLVVSAGDLPFNYYDYIVTCLNKPLLFVFGNHHLRRIGEFRRSGERFQQQAGGPTRIYPTLASSYIGSKNRRVKGVLFAGLGGSMWYNGGSNQFTDFQMFLHVLKLIPGLLLNKLRFGRHLDILVTHSPPYGIQDDVDRCHQGFKVFLWLMRRIKPRYLIHGHVHLYGSNAERTSVYFDTTVVNVYDHLVLEFEVPG